MWWMYLVEQYFPYMYALMELENDVKKNRIEEYLPEMKKQIKNKYISILRKYNKNSDTYVINDLNDLEKIDMNKEYKSVLIYHCGHLIGNEENKKIANELLEFEEETIEKFGRYKHKND